MIDGMTMAKITVSLPVDLVQRARRAVDEGRATSVSAYVAAAIIEKSDEDDFDRMLEQMLEETGGPATPEEDAWVDRVLGR